MWDYLRRLGLCGCVLAAGLGLSPSAHALITHTGPVTAYEMRTNAASGNLYVEFTLGTNGYAEVVPFAPDVIRVRYHFAALYPREELAIGKPFSNWPPVTCTFSNQNGTNLVVETSQLRVAVAFSNQFRVHFFDKSGYALSLDDRMEYDPAYQQLSDSAGYQQIGWPNESTSVSNLPSGFKLKAVRIMPTNEQYFGLGEFAGPLNRRGEVVQFWNQDTFQWGERRNPMYVSLPFWYGVRPQTDVHPPVAYGIFFHNPARPVARFNDLAGGKYSFEAGDDQLDYFFFGGGTNHTMAKVMDRYSELTGRPTMLPRWALGYHQSRNSPDYGTQTGIVAVANEFRARDFPMDALYLDIDAQNRGSQNHQLTFNGGFSNVPAMIDYCTNLGIRLVPIVEPLLTTNDPLYQEALTNLHFIKRNDLSTHVGENFLGKVSWLDFSSVFAREWWGAKITNYLANYPFEGIWNDLNEPNENAMPLNALYYLDGRYGDTVTNDSRKWHAILKNTFNVMECSHTYESLQKRRPDLRPFVLSRSGWPGIARYAVGWSGDNVSSYDHLRHNIRLGTSVMISGQPYFGHDLGGFVGTVEADLLTRWLQMGVLQPFYRNHTLSANREPWLFGSPYTEWNRRWMKFRYEIMPYLYTLAAETATNGLAMNLPTVFEFPGDVNTYSLNEYDFLVGRNLLAAPVYVEDDTKRLVYLPFGANWFFWQDDTFYLGGQTIEVPASVGTLPMFVREGTILPVGPAMTHSFQFQPPYLDLHVWPGASGEFTLYEDDGLSTNYLGGAYAKTRMTSTDSASGLQFTIHPRAGAHDPGVRTWYVVARAMDEVASVTLNGAALCRKGSRGELAAMSSNGWSYSYAERRLTVKVADTAGTMDLVATYRSPSDSDGDGLPDVWESAHFGGPTNATAGADVDGDGRSALVEYQRQTDPRFADAFTSTFTNLAVAGSFNYWNEAARNMRLVSNGLWASVQDLSGQTNVEFKFVAHDRWAFANWGDNTQTNTAVPMSHVGASGGANILIAGVATGRYTFTFNESSLIYAVVRADSSDIDRDGMTDDWEARHGFNPISHADAAWDAEADGLANSNEFAAAGHPLVENTDGDSMSDRDEFVAGTSLTNPASYFTVADHTTYLDGPSVQVRWQAVTNRLYDLYVTTNLLNNGWAPLPPHTGLTGSGSTAVVDTNGAPHAAYRLRVRLP